MKGIPRVLFCFAVLLVFYPLVLSAQNTTPLDLYIAKPDSNYKYNHYASDRGWLTSTYFLNMTSQQWRDATEVDRPLWEHEVSITVPWQARYGNYPTALLIINGGGNGSSPDRKADDALVLMALMTGQVIVNLKQVPNQPLHFLDETPTPLPRKEDAILAYGLDQFLKSCSDTNDVSTCDAEWAVHLPMTKAAVRTMDTAQDFLKKKRINIDDFFVTGGSKRGWTTWLTAAVDSRVKGIVPISIDILNIQEQIDIHWAAYGGKYAEAINDYGGFDLFCRSRNIETGKAMWDMIDPYTYRERLDIPKLIINASGDEFFLPDSSQQYFKDLPGDNRLRYTYNSGHAQDGSELDAIMGALTWMETINDNRNPPNLDWEILGNKIVVTVMNAVEDVYLWQATDAEDPLTRDFRLPVTGKIWTKTKLKSHGNGRYEAEMMTPKEGQWTAYSIEAVFDDSDGVKYTTDIFITPTKLPLNPEDHCKL